MGDQKSLMYNVSIKTDRSWQQILSALDGMDDKLRAHTERAMIKSVALVRTSVLRSGKVPYKTGTLRRSITTAMTGTRVQDMRGYVGTNLPYAAIHEYGGSFTFTRTSAFGKPTKPFTYTAHYTGRHYLRDPFKDALPEIQKIFTAELAHVVSFRKGA